MIKADTIIIAANKEALLKHLRKFKKYFIPKSIYIYFYTHCCFYKQKKKHIGKGLNTTIAVIKNALSVWVK
jgi:hypothetical protein